MTVRTKMIVSTRGATDDAITGPRVNNEQVPESQQKFDLLPQEKAPLSFPMSENALNRRCALAQRGGPGTQFVMHAIERMNGGEERFANLDDDAVIRIHNIGNGRLSDLAEQLVCICLLYTSDAADE